MKPYKPLFTEASWDEVKVEFDIVDWTDKHKYSIKKGSKYLVPMKFLSDLKKKYPKVMRHVYAKSWDRDGNLHSEFKCSYEDVIEFIKKSGLDDDIEIFIAGTEQFHNLTATRWEINYKGEQNNLLDFVDNYMRDEHGKLL